MGVSLAPIERGLAGRRDQPGLFSTANFRMFTWLQAPSASVA